MTHQDTDTSSDYHSIAKPAFEKDPWDHDYYNFVDNVDSNLKLSGTVANRPSSDNAPDDAWYEATDQNLIYRNDASNGWVVIGHGDENNPVPEGHYESLNTEQLNMTGRWSYDITEVTINTNVIDYNNQGMIKLRGESGADDSLNAIEGLNTATTKRPMIILIGNNNSETITVNHDSAPSSGNIFLSGSTDVVLDNVADTITLIGTEFGDWAELSNSNND